MYVEGEYSVRVVELVVVVGYEDDGNEEDDDDDDDDDNGQSLEKKAPNVLETPFRMLVCVARSWVSSPSVQLYSEDFQSSPSLHAGNICLRNSISSNACNFVLMS